MASVSETITSALEGVRGDRRGVASPPALRAAPQAERFAARIWRSADCSRLLFILCQIPISFCVSYRSGYRTTGGSRSDDQQAPVLHDEVDFVEKALIGQAPAQRPYPARNSPLGMPRKDCGYTGSASMTTRSLTLMISSTGRSAV